MRLRVEVTEADIQKSKTLRWVTLPWYNCPVYRAIVRQTGYRHVIIGPSKLSIHTGVVGSSYPRAAGFVYDFPPEAEQWLRRYFRSWDWQLEPVTFDLELDTRGAKVMCLNRPCIRCGDYPRENGRDVCRVCRDYRESMEAYWR